jgi:hypothetical protein
MTPLKWRPVNELPPQPASALFATFDTLTAPGDAGPYLLDGLFIIHKGQWAREDDSPMPANLDNVWWIDEEALFAAWPLPPTSNPLSPAVQGGATSVRPGFEDAISPSAPLRRCDDCALNLSKPILAAFACPMYGKPRVRYDKERNRHSVELRCIVFEPHALGTKSA